MKQNNEKVIITVIIIIKYSEFYANLSYCMHPYQLPHLWDRWRKIKGTENTGFSWDSPYFWTCYHYSTNEESRFI